MRIVAAIAVVLLAPAGQAAGRPAAGKYRGTVAGASIGFTVKAGKVRALQYGRITARCDDGSRRGVLLKSPLPRRWSVAVRKGRFRKQTVMANSARIGPLTLAGRFTSRTRVRGTLRQQFMYIPTGARCDTGALRFRARRLGSTAPTGYKIIAGSAADGSPLALALTTGGDAIRPKRMRATMQCSDGGTVTLDVRNPIGTDAAVTDAGTYSGAWRFMPPAIAGRAEPSGGGVQLSGRVTATGLDGAARLTIGFVDGTSCDGGWTRFTIAGDTAAGR